ncbi:MAG: hypothetical protein ACRC0L_05640 [Angustibacter sp.]
MHLRHLSEIGVVAGAFVVAAALATEAERPLVDFLFLGVLLSVLFVLVQLVGRSVVRARRARRHERQVVAVLPSEAARLAIEDERVRLTAEIDRTVQRSLRFISTMTASAEEASDPRPCLVAIQAESRSAMAELRRQLGLIGVDRSAARENPSIARPAIATTSSLLRLVGRGDIATVLALWVLIAAEGAVIGSRERPASWLMSAVMALTVLTRRVAPVPTALTGATVLVLSAVLDAPVSDGFSFPIVAGLLLWSVAAQSPTKRSGLLKVWLTLPVWCFRPRERHG